MNWINRGTNVLQGNIDKGEKMKKALAIFVTVCLLVSLFVSCDNTTKLDELVSTRFDAAGSRSLIVSNENFIDINGDSLTWQYKAVKETDKGYSIGASSTWKTIPQNENEEGKLNNTIEFSQGMWSFELQAVNSSSVVVYYGRTESPVLLTRQEGDLKKISINLTAQLDGQQGYIVLSGIGIKHNADDTSTFDVPDEVKIGTRVLIKDTDYTVSGNTISTTAAGLAFDVGTYTVTVKKTGANGEILAMEEKTVEVYAGLKTTISNWILEITQAGKFEPVAPTGTVTEEINESATSSVTFTVSNVTPSMVSGKNTTVTVPTNVLGGNTSATVSVAVKQVVEASSSDSFMLSSSNATAAAAIDLTLTASNSTGSSTVSTFTDPVTVNTVVAKGLSGVNVTYNGTTEGISDVRYDDESGALSFKTTHFSTFIVETSSVAVIGDTAYETLADAINAASDGDTVVLLNNTSVSNTLITLEEGKTCISIQDKGITIDGNGKAITLSAGAPDYKTYGIYITGDSSKTVTIKNTTINTTNLERAIRTEGSIGFKIENSTIKTNGVGIHVKGSNTVEICNDTQITVSVIEKYSAHLRTGVMVGGPDAVVTVEGCTINATNSEKTDDTNTWCKGLYVGNSAFNGQLTVNNTTVKADWSIGIDGTEHKDNPLNKPSKMTINGGDYSGRIGSPSGGDYKLLTIKGGTFKGDIVASSFNGNGSKLVISGGTFNVKPDSKFIKDEYCAVAQGDKWIVQEAPVVIGTTGYANLHDAIEYANTIGGTDSVTVTILSDGNYEHFKLTRDNVTVQASEDVNASIKITNADPDHPDMAVANNVTLKNLTFVTDNGSTILDSTKFSGGNNLVLDTCSFVNNNGSPTGSTALYIHEQNITIKDCTFENWERGYYTCGDNHAPGQMTFERNTFTNVLAPIDGYWGRYKTENTNISIVGNEFNPDSWGTAYIQLWDYAQYGHYCNWSNNKETGTALNATVSGNTCIGNVVLYLTHCNWFEKSSVTVSNNGSMETIYRPLVEIKNLPDGATGTLKTTGGTELTAFNEHPVINNKALYANCTGSYLLEVTNNGITRTYSVSIENPNSEGFTQKIDINDLTPLPTN